LQCGAVTPAQHYITFILYSTSCVGLDFSNGRISLIHEIIRIVVEVLQFNFSRLFNATVKNSATLSPFTPSSVTYKMFRLANCDVIMNFCLLPNISLRQLSVSSHFCLLDMYLSVSSHLLLKKCYRNFQT
jgi:hypothetical protein